MAIQVVVAGMGVRGREWVKQVRSSPAFELVGCVDVDKETLKNAANELSIPSELCFTSLSTAFEETDCQALIVATPAGDHAEACESALLRHIAVMVEKPFALRLADAARIVSLAERQKVPLMVAQNYRYMRAYRAARQLISQGAIGEVGMVVCQYFRPPHDMAPSLARLQNSVLWGVGVHHLDALRYVLAKEAINVVAESFKFPGGSLPPGASFRAMLSFEGGTRVTYTASYESQAHEFFERGQEFYTRFIGERATLHIFQRWLLLYEGKKLPRIIKRGSREVTEEQLLLGQLERAILHNEPPEVNGRENLKTMALLEACVRSADEQQWINPQDLLNEYNH